MKSKPISPKKKQLWNDDFNPQVLLLLPNAHMAILKLWLKSPAKKSKWDTLLKIAVKSGGNAQVENAESLAEHLVECGAAMLEQHWENSVWKNSVLVWKDYEQLNRVLGISTPLAQRTAFNKEWNAARDTDWNLSSLSDAYQTLEDAPAKPASGRLLLLLKLNQWLVEGEAGTRRDFSLYATGHTKKISTSDWEWLGQHVSLSECGIENHSPAFWIAGDIQLNFGSRQLDVGAIPQALGLMPQTLSQLTTAISNATYFRLVENRTSFEKLAFSYATNPEEIIIWLPGYAPKWWSAAMDSLLKALPLPARISCDADPDGVQIALQAGSLWVGRELSWTTYQMDELCASQSKHTIKMSVRDMDLAARLLKRPDIPQTLQRLLEWCMDKKLKAEQENWIGTNAPF